MKPHKQADQQDALPVGADIDLRLDRIDIGVHCGGFQQVRGRVLLRLMHRCGRALGEASCESTDLAQGAERSPTPLTTGSSRSTRWCRTATGTVGRLAVRRRGVVSVAITTASLATLRCAAAVVTSPGSPNRTL